MYTYKIHIFIVAYDIIIMINHIIHISNSLIKQLKNIYYTSNYIFLLSFFVFL